MCSTLHCTLFGIYIPLHRQTEHHQPVGQLNPETNIIVQRVGDALSDGAVVVLMIFGIYQTEYDVKYCT